MKNTSLTNMKPADAKAMAGEGGRRVDDFLVHIGIGKSPIIYMSYNIILFTMSYNYFHGTLLARGALNVEN